MVTNLLLIDSGLVGSHDLWWAESVDSTKGYNIYRAHDYPDNWVKLNQVPWTGHFFRDMTTLQQVTYTVKPEDFIEKGEVGQFVFRLPEVPYTTVQSGRVTVSNSPDDVMVIADGVSYRPTSVNAFDRTVTMLVDNTLAPGGAVSATALVSAAASLISATVAVASDIATVVFPALYNFSVNEAFLFSGLTVNTFLNGNSYTLSGVSVTPSTTTVTFAVSQAYQQPLVETSGSIGNVSVADYSGVQTWQVVFNKLVNFVDIYSNFSRTYYCVVPVGDKGEVHKPGAPGTVIKNTQEVDAIDWVFEEMVRRNEYLFNTTGEPALCFFRMWRGEACGCVFGSQQPKTACPICFETGFVGGYHGPYDFLFVPPDSAINRILDEGGIKTTRTSRSYMTRTPIVQNGDMILRANGDIMVITDVVYKMPRGIILQQDFTVELLSPGDTRYLAASAMIRKNYSSLPTLFNPIVRPDPNNGLGTGQPVFDPRTVPNGLGGKDWENVNVRIGKIVEFGKLQT